MTVLGPVPAGELGICLMHEHILVDASKKWRPPCGCTDPGFADRPVSADMQPALRRHPVGNRDNCLLLDGDLAVSELMHFTDLGGRTIVDATVGGIGRDLPALRRISVRTGLHVIAGTGFYLGSSHPEGVRDASIEDLAEVIVSDVGGLAERPRILAGLIGEIGISPDFTPQEEKCLRAAARAAARTGVPLSIHLPGWERFGDRVLDIAEAEGADLAHTILCHMNPSLADEPYQHRLARRGCFLEYDMIGMDYFFAEKGMQSPSDAENAAAIRNLMDAGFIDRLLLSHDIFLKMMLMKYGGHGYGHILRSFLPRLRQHGVGDDAIEILMISNPRRVFGG